LGQIKKICPNNKKDIYNVKYRHTRDWLFGLALDNKNIIAHSKTMVLKNKKTRQNRDNTHENDKKEGHKKTTAEHRGETNSHKWDDTKTEALTDFSWSLMTSCEINPVAL
jgi:hypothetical protein